MNTQLYPVSFQQIDIFFTVVESNSFTNAAAKLHMTQSAVSKNIAKLEKDLDLVLFTRHYREIRITESGEKLYAQWKAPMKLLSDIYEKMHAEQEKERHLLRIGADNTTDLDLYFRPLIHDFQKKHPDIRVDLSSNNRDRLIEYICSEQLDLVFVPDFMRYRIEKLNLSWKWASKDFVQVIIPETHPLADKELSVHDLKDLTIVVLNELNHPENMQYFKDTFLSKGYSLHISDNTYQTPESIMDFYRKDDILLTDRYFKFDEKKWHAVRKPVKGFQNGIISVWNPENYNPGLQKFLLLKSV